MNHRALRRHGPALVVGHGLAGGIGIQLPVGEGDFEAAHGDGLANVDRARWAFVVVTTAQAIAQDKAASGQDHQFGALLAVVQWVAKHLAGLVGEGWKGQQQG